MSPDSIAATKMLSALSSVEAALSNTARGLRQRREIIRVITDIEHFQSKDSDYPSVNAYMDVDISGDETVTWHLQITLDEEKWLIKRYIARSDINGQQSIFDFPEMLAYSLNDLIDGLQTSVMEIDLSATSFDYGSLSLFPA